VKITTEHFQSETLTDPNTRSVILIGAMTRCYSRYMLYAVLFSALPLFSQDSPQLKACSEKATTQLAINACASKEADRVDAKLNTAYHQLLGKAMSEENAVRKIKAAERDWIAYRDAYIEAMYPATNKRTEYGSMYAMDVALLRAKLTQQHLAEIQYLLKAYSGDSGAGPSHN
jgi:uncharacterized protein YecT (DUF1311 family)